MSHATNPQRLRAFIQEFTHWVSGPVEEADILAKGRVLLADLVAHDDWLPDAFAQADPQRYQQYLLHADPLERFSVVSFVWGAGQFTPIHNHTVWGLIGVLRGQEISQSFAQSLDGRWIKKDQPHTLAQGQVEVVSPSIGDVHRVSNALADQTSISIHVYGANIGAVERSVFLEDGTRKPFVSGYSNNVLPNLWDRSAVLNAKLRASV
jgi:predicted metal-dependent enzyme (double-stranded beta helix superfamily)